MNSSDVVRILSARDGGHGHCSFLQCPKKGLHDSSGKNNDLCYSREVRKLHKSLCFLMLFFKIMKNLQKTVLNKSTFAKAKSL